MFGYNIRMLVYTKSGPRNFREDPVEVKRRDHWEFWGLLAGSVVPVLGDPKRGQAASTTPSPWP